MTRSHPPPPCPPSRTAGSRAARHLPPARRRRTPVCGRAPDRAAGARQAGQQRGNAVPTSIGMAGHQDHPEPQRAYAEHPDRGLRHISLDNARRPETNGDVRRARRSGWRSAATLEAAAAPGESVFAGTRVEAISFGSARIAVSRLGEPGGCGRLVDGNDERQQTDDDRGKPSGRSHCQLASPARPPIEPITQPGSGCEDDRSRMDVKRGHHLRAPPLKPVRQITITPGRTSLEQPSRSAARGNRGGLCSTIAMLVMPHRIVMRAKGLAGSDLLEQ